MAPPTLDPDINIKHLRQSKLTAFPESVVLFHNHCAIKHTFTIAIQRHHCWALDICFSHSMQSLILLFVFIANVHSKTSHLQTFVVKLKNVLWRRQCTAVANQRLRTLALISARQQAGFAILYGIALSEGTRPLTTACPLFFETTTSIIGRLLLLYIPTTQSWSR